MRDWIKNGINNYINYKSFKTNKKYVIIESDDWGSLRTKDSKARDALNALHPNIKNDPFTQYDSIASCADLQALFEVLNSVKDRKDNPACITANVCTANPHFKKISDNNFEDFYFEPFTKTLEGYSKDKSIFEVWNEGIKSKLFYPQLHGREHLHALAWLKELQAGQKSLLKAFHYETWSIPYTSITNNQRRKNLQAALDHYQLDNEIKFQEKWINDASQIFKDEFGFTSKTFIPPTYKWHSNLNSVFQINGIEALQGIKLQYQPSVKHKSGYNRKLHYTGQVDKGSNLLYLTRNVFFEPSLQQNKDWYSLTLNGVKEAFKKSQPAIIGSHRINFVGRLDENRRDNNLKVLRSILKQITKLYPDVEFVNSSDLTTIIKK